MRSMWLGVALAALFVAGCGETPDGGTAPKKGEKKAITVGFSQIGAESAWRTAETESIQSEAKKRGINLKFSDAQQKQENQIKAIRSFIAQKVDAIVLAPVVERDNFGLLEFFYRAGFGSSQRLAFLKRLA